MAAFYMPPVVPLVVPLLVLGVLYRQPTFQAWVQGESRIIERWQRSEGIVSGRSWSAWQGPQPLVGEHAADRVGMGLSPDQAGA